MQSSGLECWLWHPAHKEAQQCSIRSAQEIKPDYLPLGGKSCRGTVPPGQQAGAQQDKINWKWDFTGGNTTTRGKLPSLQGEQSPSLLICKTF